MVTKITKNNIDQLVDNLQKEFGAGKLAPLLTASENWKQRYPEGTDSEWTKSMILEALSYIAEDETYWTFVAARLLLHNEYAKRGYQYENFAGHVEKLVSAGLYDSFLTEKYSRKDL